MSFPLTLADGKRLFYYTTGRLVVVGAFTDGAQQVILDRTFY